jgi:hypothetical protein
MADTQESYPLPTTGKGKPLFIKLTGIGVSNANPETPSGTLVGGNNTYKVTLSVANSISAGASATVAITASLYDLAGTFQSVSGSVTALSYNALPTSFSGTIESYPAPKAQVGAVASVGAVTYSASAGVATITPLNPGQAVVEFDYPFGGNGEGLIGGSLPQQNDAVYSQVLVTVVP